MDVTAQPPRQKRKRGRPKDDSNPSDQKIPKNSETDPKKYDSQEEADDQTMALPLSTRLKSNLPDDPPLNKDGYKYYLAEPDPLNPERLNKELDYHGGVIPSKHYRRWWPNRVLLNVIDSAPQLKIDNRNLTVLGNHGYSSVRATHSVTTGTWYYRALNLKKTTNFRVLGQNSYF